MLKQQMNDYLQDKIGLAELTNLIEDRLFELRQSLVMSEEQEVLSNLELLIHESSEGLRSKDELYEAIRIEALPELNNTICISISMGTSFQIHTAISPTNEYQCLQQAVPA
jgi:hypothetical protein